MKMIKGPQVADSHWSAKGAWGRSHLTKHARSGEQGEKGAQ